MGEAITGDGGEKGRKSASTPPEVPSNFPAVARVVAYAGHAYSDKHTASVWCPSSRWAYTQTGSPGGSADAASIRLGYAVRVGRYRCLKSRGPNATYVAAKYLQYG